MYGILISFAVIFCTFIALSFLKTQSQKDHLWNGLFWVLLAAIAGARIYHVLDYLPYYLEDPMDILKIYNGGLGIFGGIAGGLVAALIYIKKNKLDALKWLDIAAVVLPLGQAIGRWGNYFNNENMPFAIYESVLDFVLFISLYSVYKFGKVEKGVTTGLYLLGYGLIRYTLEPLRNISWSLYGINMAQMISLIFVIAGISIILVKGGKACRVNFQQKS